MLLLFQQNVFLCLVMEIYLYTVTFHIISSITLHNVLYLPSIPNYEADFLGMLFYLKFSINLGFRELQSWDKGHLKTAIGYHL